MKRFYCSKRWAEHGMGEVVTVVPCECVALVVEREAFNSAHADDISRPAAPG